MKKENKLKKRESERKEIIAQREARFKKQGTISMIVILACATAMFIVAIKVGGTAVGKNLVIVLGVIVAIAFVYSVINASRRIREMKEERDQDF